MGAMARSGSRPASPSPRLLLPLCLALGLALGLRLPAAEAQGTNIFGRLVGGLAGSNTNANANANANTNVNANSGLAGANTAYRNDAIRANSALKAIPGYTTFARLNAINNVYRTLSGNRTPQPVTIFAPSDTAVQQASAQGGGLARGIFGLPRFLGSSVVKGYITPAQLATAPIGARLGSVAGNPIVKNGVKNGAVVLGRTAGSAATQQKVSRVIYRGKYFIVYGVTSLLENSRRT